jgi:AcrR family transcriptional regulator
MGVTERRERAKADLRARILEAARVLFAAHGYDAVTMRRIAEAIEYSPTAIYGHFADKVTLFRELCLLDFAALATAFQKIARERDPLERLRKIGLAYVDFAIAYPNHYRMMFMTPHPPEMKGDDLCSLGKGNPEKDAYELLRATVVEAIEEGQLRPDLKDAHLVAQAAWAGVHGIISLQIAKKDDPWVDWRPIKRTAALVVDSMIRGISREES